MGRAPLSLLLIVALLAMGAAACAGSQVPAHTGYKGKKPAPWKKAKLLKFDDKLEAKAEGDLSYADYKRAAWYVADLAQPGALDIRIEITPPGDAVNDEFDLGLEILDAGFRTIAKSDLEDGEAGELTKAKSLVDLEAGKYYVHLYLQGRLDSADFQLRAAFKPVGSVGKSDFPAQVAILPTLPMVPLQDDTPATYRPPTTTVTTTRKPKTTKTDPKPEVKPEPAAAPSAAGKTARIIGIQVVGGKTQITIGRGTAGGATVGLAGKIVGVASGTFTLATCGERTCTALVAATPDQIKGSGSVVLAQ